MPHTAFSCGAIFDNCPLKIESLAAWGPKLLVGTSEGLLLIMGEQPGDEGAGGRLPKFHILDTKRGFSKKPIVQLNVLGPEGGNQMLVSLSDTISLHRLPSFELIMSMPKTKGCNLYCLSNTVPSAAPLFMCAAVRKKVLIYLWQGPGQALTETKELTMPDLVKSAVFCRDSVCLGTKRDYFMVHTATGEVKELFPVSQAKDGNPVAVVLPSESGEMLLARDTTGIFIGFNGKPTRKYGLHWNEPPLALAVSYPYILAASARSVDIRCIANDKKVPSQSEQLRGVHSLLAQPDGAGYGGKVFVASSGQGGKSQVHLMQPAPLLDQVDELVGMSEYTEALALCDQVQRMPPDSMPCRESELVEKARSIHREQGFRLFDRGEFDTAIERFEDAALHPQEVVDLFPELLWDGDADAAPRRVAHERQEPLLALTSYLESTRTKLDGSPEDLRVVNTALLKCFVLTHHAAKLSEHVALPAPLCPCDVPDCAGFLLQHSKEDEAVVMYKSHGRHRDALDLLCRVGKAKIQDGYEGCLEEGLQETVTYLQQLGPEDTDLICEYSTWVLEEDEGWGLKIFTASDRLDQARILRHLKAVRSSCVHEYLEFVVAAGNDNEDHHNELVRLFVSESSHVALLTVIGRLTFARFDPR